MKNPVKKFMDKLHKPSTMRSKRDRLKDGALHRVELENALESEISPLKDELKGEEE